MDGVKLVNLTIEYPEGGSVVLETNQTGTRLHYNLGKSAISSNYAELSICIGNVEVNGREAITICDKFRELCKDLIRYNNETKHKRINTKV